MKRPDIISQVKSGLRLTALILVGFVVAAMFFGGVVVLSFPGGVDRSSFVGRHASVVVPIFLGVSMPIMVLTMNRWVKVMAGFLGLAGLNGLLSISSGHVLANPSKPISRLGPTYLKLFFAMAAILTSTMKAPRVGVLDRLS